MTDATGIFFQGLLFFLLLHIIGHPIITVVLRRRGIPWRLKSLDFIERLPLEFVAGGIVVYIVALLMTPFKGFNAFTSWGVTGMAAVFYLYQHRKGIASVFRQPSLRSLVETFVNHSLYSWVAIICFIIALAIRVGPISNFLLGSNQDISMHTLYTYSIVENAGIPNSAIPGYLLQTPVATHTILAYFSVFTATAPEFVTFHGLVFFGAIAVLAAYLFGSMLHSQEFGLYVSILMVSISVFPIGITWGSPWLVLGILSFFVTSAVAIPVFSESYELSRSWIYTGIFIGILSGFLASVYVPLYVIFLLTLLLLIIVSRQDIPRKLGGLVITFAAGIPLFAIWIYRYFFVHVSHSTFFVEGAAAALYEQALRASTTFLPLRYFYSPSVIIDTIGNWLTWSSKLDWPGAYVFVPLLGAGCFFLFYQFIKQKSNSFRDPVLKYIIAMIIVVFLWGLNGPLGVFYVPDYGLSIMIGELDKIAAIMGTILLPFIIAYLLISLNQFLSKHSKANHTPYHMVFFLLSVSIAIVPLSQAWLVSNYNMYATSTESDYALLKWMNSEIPAESDVLINPFDAGQYVPSIGGQKAFGIASTGVVYLNEQYAVLHYHINNQILDNLTVAVLRNVDVDYIFVGGYAWKENWDAQYFIRNPLYFRIVYKIENSYLFAVKIPDKNLNTGFVNNTDYLGFSNSEMLIDLKHMAMYNLETGEGVQFEISLKDDSNNVEDLINPWNVPKKIEVLSTDDNNSSITFSILGNYSYNLALSSNKMKEISLNLSVEGAPKSSMVYFSYYPVYDVKQSNIHFCTENLGDWSLPNKSMVQTIRKGGATSFDLIPNTHSVLGWEDYILVRSNTFVNIALKTRSLNELD
jgi:uncharacterized membrane-anchored protein